MQTFHDEEVDIMVSSLQSLRSSFRATLKAKVEGSTSATITKSSSACKEGQEFSSIPLACSTLASVGILHSSFI